MMKCEVWLKKFITKKDEDYMIIEFNLDDMELSDDQIDHLKDIIKEAESVR